MPGPVGNDCIALVRLLVHLIGEALAISVEGHTAVKNGLLLTTGTGVVLGDDEGGDFSLLARGDLINGIVGQVAFDSSARWRLLALRCRSISMNDGMIVSRWDAVAWCR